VIVSCGKHQYKEVNLAFHLIRENAYSPWQSIGVFVVWHNFAKSRYVWKHRHLNEEFYREVEEAGPAAFNYDFLDRWHKRHQNSLDVVSKVIRYCTDHSNLDDLTKKLGECYTGNINSHRWGMLAMMLRQPRYFPIRFCYAIPDRLERVQSLRQAGLIQ